MADSVRVLMTQRFAPELVERVRAVSPRLDVEQRSVSSDSDEARESFNGDEEILYCIMPPRDLSVAPKLKWVQLHSAGINQLAHHPILKTDIRITTSSGIHAVPIGEFSIALMLALARHVPTMVREQDRSEWPRDRWGLFVGTELYGKTLGIIGYGSIGRHAARIAKHGLGMRIIAMTRGGEKRDRGYHAALSQSPVDSEGNLIPRRDNASEPGTGDPDGILPDAWFHRPQLLDLLAQSDYVLIAAPLTDETRNLIGERELRGMKPSAFILNIARGGIIEEEALVRALKEKWIAGAGLDVFEKEPLPQESPLWKCENALIAPHVSSATPHYDTRATKLFCENLRRYLDGRELLNLVDRGKGY